LDSVAPMPRLLRARRALALVLALVASAVGLVAPAAAETVPIESEPLTVHIGDYGRLQATVAGRPGGMFFPPDSTTGDAGLFLAFPAATDPPPPAAVAGKVYGFADEELPEDIAPYFAGAQGAVTGRGTAADPFRQQTTFGVPDVAEVTQTTTYVAGETSFTVRWEVRNATSSPLTFKALAAADFYADGSDVGTGVYIDGPSRFVGSTNPDTGASMGFAELPAPVEPWWRYEVLAAGSGRAGVWGRVRTAALDVEPTLLDVLLAAPADNAGAIEWDGHVAAPLAAGATASLGVAVRTTAPNGLRVVPTSARGPQGVALRFTVTAVDTSGAPLAGRTVRYSIAGANSASGSVVTDADGAATVVDPGTNAGTDAVVAFLDLDGNGARESTEDQASGVAVFADQTPPDCAVRVARRRPGGNGSAPRPLLASIRCTERATITARPRLAMAAGPSGPARRIRLPTVRAVVGAERATRVRLRLPARVRTRYAGARAVATVAVTARDGAGNLGVDRGRRRVRLAD
jgi:hypothetical protein